MPAGEILARLPIQSAKVALTIISTNANTTSCMDIPPFSLTNAARANSFPPARSLKLEFSSLKRSKFREAGHL